MLRECGSSSGCLLVDDGDRTRGVSSEFIYCQYGSNLLLMLRCEM
jgi:hypothetical protein